MKLTLGYSRPRGKGDRNFQKASGDLFEEGPYALFSVGIDNRIRLANQPALELLGYQLDELLGRSVFDLYADTPDGKRKAQVLFLQFRAGTAISGEELDMRGADGAPVRVRLSVRGIRNSEGDIVTSWSIVDQISPGDKSQKAHHTGRLRLREPANAGDDSLQQLNGLPREYESKEKHLTRLMVKSEGRLVFLKAGEVDWIEAAGNYVQLHVGQRSHLLRATMDRLQSKLDPSQFLRIHRSAMVNIERIKELWPWSSGDYKVILQNGVQLTLSRSYRKNLRHLTETPI